MKAIASIIALALIAIAINLTIMTVQQGQSSNEHQLRGKVNGVDSELVEVVSRVTMPYDGIGATYGYLVRRGNELDVVYYDQGSHLANMDAPKYLEVVRYADGKTGIQPVISY